MTNYAVLVYEDIETKMKISVDVNEESIHFELKRQQVLDLEADHNYKLVSVIATTDKGLFLKSRVKAKLSELISYTQHYEEYFRDTQFSSEEVKEQSFRCYLDYEKVLIRRVSLAVEHCIFENVPVDSELALACYDYRHRELANRNIM